MIKHLPTHIMVSIHQAPTYWKWFTNGASPKWILYGSYPKAWLIFSAVMLHPYFVGVVAGSQYNLVIPPHIHNDLIHVHKLWFPVSKRKPPDPLYTVKIYFDDHEEAHTTYDINQTDVVYAVSRRQTSTVKRGALVDRGANGGLAGSDVRALYKTDRQVDVQGIDNHQLTNIPIVTAAGVVESQHGPIVLIMNQYAHLSNGKTIHSSAQLEAHGITVDDRAISNGGYQRIITQGGYVIPLQVRSGLVYMDMRPPTDSELKPHGDGGLPQIILTSDQDWVPASVDYEHDSEQWFDSMENLPDLDYNSPFNEDGEYRFTHDLETNLAAIEASIDLGTELLSNVHDTIESTRQPRHRKASTIDFAALQPKFGWLPVDVIKSTFENTTQFYRTPASPQLKKRFRSPYPACNVQRRQEPLATDTVFSDTPAIDDGSKVAQIFVGTESCVIDVFGMKTETQFVNTLQDIIRTRGAPTKLISDSAQTEISNKVKDILRYLFIEDWQSEAYHQHQNPCERCYQDMKRIANRLLDRTDSPPSLWLLALKYTAYLLNHTSSQQLDGKVPLQVLTGVTQDLSALLRFHWYERVYYRVDESSFPSETAEACGHFVGFSENVGHALTFAILTEDTNKIIYRSEVRTAEDSHHPNLRTHDWGDDHNSKGIICSKSDDSQTNEESTRPMALVDPEELVGFTFDMPDKHGNLQATTIVKAIDEHQKQIIDSSKHKKFKVSRNNDQYEEILSYNEIVDYIEKQGEEPLYWELRHIVSHQGPLQAHHPSYKGSPYNVRVEWENGEITDEPISIIAVDAPVACAIYARKNGLLDKPGWRRFKRIAKKQGKYFTAINKAKI